MNDVLIAASVVACEKWNSQCGFSTARLVVHVPIRRQDAEAVAGLTNATGQAVVVIDAASRAKGRVLAAVAQQTQLAKARRGAQRGLAERVVGSLSWLPATLRRRLLQSVARAAAPFLMPTLSVSNLGRIGTPKPAGYRSPVKGLRSLHFITTAPMPQGIAVTALGMGEHLHLGVTFAHNLFDDAAANAFLTLVVQEMQAFMDDQMGGCG